MTRFSISLLSLIACSTSVFAQNKIISGDSIVFIEKTIRKIDKNFNFTILPGPVYNASSKIGFAVLPMLVYRLDKKDSLSPTSSTAALLYYNINGSWMVAAKQNFYWNRDKWRGIITFGYGQFYQKFFGLGRDTAVIYNDSYVWAHEKTFTFSTTCYRKIIAGFYGGLEYNYSNILLTGTDTTGTDVLENDGVPTGSSIGSIITPTFVWDNRDNIYFSSKGFYSMLNLRYSDKFFQSTRNYFVMTAFVNGYHTLLPNSKKLTLAWRVFYQGSWGNLSYNELANYGDADGVLGYTPGKYVNNSELNGQTEIRYDIWKFIGVAGFIGTGKIFPTLMTFGQSVWLHFAGVGLYLNVIPSQNLRMRLNLAFGRGDFGFYIGLGQLF